MPESFGARLRQQREKRGIALEALAKQTKIKESLIEALERDDLSQWPSGFYRRAFFRAYASAIGLDADVAYSEFQAVYPEAPATDVMTAMAATLGRNEGPARSTVLRNAVESAISSLARLRGAPPGESDARAAEARQMTSPAGPPPAAPAQPVDAPSAASSAVMPQGSEPQRAEVQQAEAQRRQSPAMDVQRFESAAPAEPQTDLVELARLCVGFGCVTSEEDVRLLLQHAARMIGAAGLIVWVLNPRELQLEAALVHGYPPKLVAQLPVVRRGDNNATAEALRTTETRVFNDRASGKCALAIPLRTASGCVGVFAVELERGLEATRSRIGVATVLAAQLAPIADSLSGPAHFHLPRAVNADVQTV